MDLRAFMLTNKGEGGIRSAELMIVDLNDPHSGTGGIKVTVDYEKKLWGVPPENRVAIEMRPIGEPSAETPPNTVFVVFDADDEKQCETATDRVKVAMKFYLKGTKKR